MCKEEKFSIVPKIINGAAAGIMCNTAVFPLDLVKTRLQTQPVGPNGEKMYHGILDAFVKVFQQEGFFGMYKGLGVTLVFVTGEKSFKLTCNDFLRHHLMLPDKTVPIGRQILAAALTGFLTVTITTPMEFLKIQKQDAGRVRLAGAKSEVPPTTIQTIRHIYKKYGPLGFYKGYVPCALRDIFYHMIYFPVFFGANALGPRRENKPDEAKFWVSFAAGFLAGCTSAFCATPFDVVKTRLQAIAKTEGEIVYNSIPHAFATIYRKEGLQAFFKGSGCRVLVIAPSAGVAQSVYYVGLGEYLFGDDKESE